MKVLNSTFVLLLMLILVGCDAVNIMSYSVKNKTDKTISIQIPSTIKGGYSQSFNHQKDTVIQLKPDETAWIGRSEMDIDFPWATKKIYKKTPGVCGLSLLFANRMLPLSCEKSDWKYRRGTSTLLIKPLMLQ